MDDKFSFVFYLKTNNLNQSHFKMKAVDLDIFKIVHNDIPPKKGRVLISEPFQQGYHFSRSLVLITEHNQHGSMGVVLNKRLDVTAGDLIRDFPLEDVTLWCGGPVSPDRLYYVHSFGTRIKGSLHIKGNLYFGGEFPIIVDLLNESPELISQISFFVGYAGWKSGQLKSEIDDDAWLVTDMSEHQILSGSTEGTWKNAVSKLGKKYENWVNFPRDPVMN